MTYLNNTKYKIIWFDNFKKDFDNIYNYIYFKLKEPKITNKFYKKVISSISSLTYFPQRYPKQNNPKNYNFHRLIICNYVLIYEVDILLR